MYRQFRCGFQDSDYAILVGARPRGAWNEDLLEANAAFFLLKVKH